MDKEQWDALAVIRMERAKELLTESQELLEMEALLLMLSKDCKGRTDSKRFRL